MWTDLSLRPLAEDDLDWATELERTSVLGRTWTIGGFVPHPGDHADRLGNGADALLVACTADGAPQCLIWVYRRTPSPDHVYLALLADPEAPPAFAVVALAGAIERHFRHAPTGEILLEVADPNLGSLHRLLSGSFEECARLRSAIWMDGGWSDLTVWRCDANRWRTLVGDSDSLSGAHDIVSRLLAAEGSVRSDGRAGAATNAPSASTIAGLTDNQIVELILGLVAARDPEAIDDLRGTSVDLDTPIAEVVDSLGALVMVAVVGELTATAIDDLLAESDRTTTFADLVRVARRGCHVPA